MAHSNLGLTGQTTRPRPVQNGAVTDDAVIARKVVAYGRVQGVFFRDSCRREAEQRGVTGWVSNEPDGSVAAVFEGAPDAVAAMITWMRTGPPRADVERVEVADTRPPGEARFRIR